MVKRFMISLTEAEKELLRAALHTEAVLSGDDALAEAVRQKLRLDE